MNENEMDRGKDFVLRALAADLGLDAAAFSDDFDFMAGDTVLPAGDYDVQSTDTWGGKALSIHNVTSNAGTLILSDSCQMAKTSDSNKLVFYRYGNRYFLAEVWTANTNIGRKMPLNQRQKELAVNQQKSEVVLMASGKYR